MDLSPITSAFEASEAFQAAHAEFAPHSVHFPGKTVGWPSGSGRFDVYWNENAGFWALFSLAPPIATERPRFWICFGLEHPESRSALSITVEINPPHSGINKRVAGLFLRAPDGGLFLGHSGRVGGGEKGSVRPPSTCSTRVVTNNGSTNSIKSFSSLDP
jgi:hypothetical protein